jgi:hypothetical protein
MVVGKLVGIIVHINVASIAIPLRPTLTNIFSFTSQYNNSMCPDFLGEDLLAEAPRRPLGSSAAGLSSTDQTPELPS